VASKPAFLVQQRALLPRLIVHMTADGDARPWQGATRILSAGRARLTTMVDRGRSLAAIGQAEPDARSRRQAVAAARMRAFALRTTTASARHARERYVRLREWLAPAVRFALVALLGLGFVILGETVVHGRRQRFDNDVSLYIHRHLGGHWTTILLWATNSASAPVVIPIALGLSGWLLRRHQPTEARVVAGAWVGGQILHLSLKFVYQRRRPNLFRALVTVNGYSFPSGHTVTAVMTYGLLAVVVQPSLPPELHWTPGVLASGMVALVGLSRVYLGAHFPTDVFASILIGGAWLRCAVLAIDKIHDWSAPDARPAAQAALAF